jgi:hypothetical protein
MINNNVIIPNYSIPTINLNGLTLLNLYYMIFVQRKHIQHRRDIANRKKAKAK